jgi:hypothetical protein
VNYFTEGRVHVTYGGVVWEASAMIIDLLVSIFANDFVAPRTSLLQPPTFATWRDFWSLVPAVFACNVVVAIVAWILVLLVMR